MASTLTRIKTVLYYLAIVNCVLVVKGLNLAEIKLIAATDDNSHFINTSKQILKSRIVGSSGHEEVKQFIINDLQSMDMHVELDEFNSVVPIFGNLSFTNIIGKLNEDADKYITLACHYDSKYLPNEYFEAAIDSAIPCALMLNIVKTLQPALTNFRNRTDISLMLIFFDGEEAFKDWNKYDSLYGSRHLAKKWTSESYQMKSQAGQIRQIDRIEFMVLLDLIGAANPKFFSFFKRTEGLHNRLYEIEQTLIHSASLYGNNTMFLPRNTFSSIDDDHKPFLSKNVAILHLIPIPFPKQWHTVDDNASNLSPTTISNFNKILRVFTLEYLIKQRRYQ